jgi:hypothetical protein
MAIKVTSIVRVYEINGKEAAYLENHGLKICSHWNNPDRIELTFGDESQKLTILAADLIAAIKNATNTAKF